MKIRRTMWTAVSVAVLATACSSGNGTEVADPEPEQTAASVAPEAEPTPEPTPEPTSTPELEPESQVLPVTAVVGALDDAYDFQGGSPDPALLPAQPGTVEVQWYRTASVYAVVYVGLGAEVDACPGNSAFTGGSFQFVSNAELPNGACPDFPTRIDSNSAQGVQVCQGTVAYLTLIPATTVGTFFASLEKPDPNVLGVGLTVPVEITDPAAVPEIDGAALSC